jgi:HAD superfamily phosphoserine phosphatase-like hydrolase
VPRPPLHVFSDFDGTIVVPDTLRFLVERFGGGPAHFGESERLLSTGALAPRDVIARDVGSVQTPLAELHAELLAGVRVDPGFPGFAAWCARAGVPLTVLSAGFEEIARLFLSADAYPRVDVLASRLAPGTWTPVFRDDSPFGHDKAAAVRAARAGGARTVYVGDGVSDVEAAAVADVAFARRGGSLVRAARRDGFAVTPFDTFADVQAALAR